MALEEESPPAELVGDTGICKFQSCLNCCGCWGMGDGVWGTAGVGVPLPRAASRQAAGKAQAALGFSRLLPPTLEMLPLTSRKAASRPVL